METKQLTEQLSVSGQITVADLESLKAAGIKSIICNRPDNEEPNQISHVHIEAATKENGMAFVFMPVISGQVTQDNVADFGRALTTLPQPVHAYCRSGMRCTSLWGLSETLKGADKPTILETAAQSGYDLSKVL